MAVTLGTDWKKVCEVSTKVTQNITGYTRLYMKYGNRSGLNDTIYYEIRQLAYNPYGSYFAWQWDGSIAWSIKSGSTTKASGSFTQPAIYSTKTDSTANEVVRANGSYVQPHNADGTFSDTLTFTAPINNSSYNTTGDIVLPNIAVNPTLVINSAGVMTVNYGASINYTLGSTNGRTIKLQYSINNSTWTDWHTKNADGTYSYALPTLVSSFPNTYTPTIYFRAITGNYSSGSKSKQVTIDSNIKPSISSVVINPVNTYSVLTNNNLFVKSLTKPRITTTASAYANGGATLSQYDLTALGGYNSSISKTNVGNNYTYGTAFQKSGSYTATVKVIDTRGGNVSKTSGAITVIDYYNPSITSVSVQRCLQNGTLSDTGTYCKLSVTYKIAPITSGSTSYNTKSLKYKIGSGSWTTISISSYNTTITQVIGGSLSTNSSYQISVQLQDLTTTVTQVVTLPTSFVLVSKRTGGKGITFGAIAEQDDLHSHLDSYFHKDLYVNNRLLNQVGSYMKGNMTNDYTVQQIDTIETLPINTSYAKVGNLTNSNNGIKIGAGIHTVLVSGNIYLYTNVTNGAIGYIYRNTQQMCVVNYPNNGNYKHLVMPTITLSVTEGDIIYLKINAKSTLLVKNYASGTFLNVTVLN